MGQNNKETFVFIGEEIPRGAAVISENRKIKLTCVDEKNNPHYTEQDCGQRIIMSKSTYQQLLKNQK